MCIELAKTLQGQCIWGMPRGGLIVASVMSFHGCQLVESPFQARVIVDDISDTGKTLSTFKQTTAALVVRKGCDPVPNHWVMMLNTSDYILFPWEDKQEAEKLLEQGLFKDSERR